MTVEAAESPSTHVNMRRIHPGYKKEEEEEKEDVLLSSNDVLLSSVVLFVLV